LIFVAIRSGDYYMFDYQSDEEEDEGNQDEATIAQEQVNKKNKTNKELCVILDSSSFNIN
jgi:hypothetical protein